MKKCVTSIFTLIALLLLNVTNVSADSRTQSFTFRYVKGAPSSSSTCINNFSLPAYSSGIDVHVSQLTDGAQLLVSSSGLNPKQTIIDKVGTYHLAISPMSTGSSVTVSIRLIHNEVLPASDASGSIGYSD